MLLKKLEAYGFKSFANKTEIEFGKGITVIVGPNGSGKSNISDAIRWVLGEQSIRTLRGAKSEDIIFAGSSGRKALGLAEVSLLFDNTDGSLPIDFNEVIITRRVYRSGESEYFINKTQCRLKDIYDLLADTGLGREAMTVIGQNKVDEILNSKPEERRLFFEEAAGITKYKQRKRDALRKLEDTTNNLTRVADITTEIESQLIPLGESAQRTKQYNELSADLKVCQVTILLDKLYKAKNMVDSANDEQTRLSDLEIAASTNLTLKETEQEKLTTQLAQVEEQLVTLNNAINQSNQESERTQGKIAVLEERITQGLRNQERSNQEQLRLQTQSNEFDNNITDSQTKLTVKEAKAKELQTVLSAKSKQYQAKLNAAEQLERQLEENKGKAFDYLQEVVNERNKHTTLERDIGKIKIRQVGFAGEYEQNIAELNKAAQLSNEVLSESKSLKQTDDELYNNRQLLVSQKAELESGLENNNFQVNTTTTKLNEVTSRFKILSSMQNDYEGFSRGIKSILKSEGSWRKGISGAVAQIINVPNKYVTAIEIALGGALQHIVAENTEVAKQAMNFLKTKNLGRATFLPLNTIRPKKPRDIELNAAVSKGALGFAAQLVKCDERYQNIIEFLLGRTIIAENIDVALKIAKDCAYNVKIVTLDGELLNPGGSMTGGSVAKKESSFLSRSNEIKDAQVKIVQLKNELLKFQEQANATKTAINNITQELLTIEKHLQKNKVRQAEISVYKEKLAIDIKRLNLAIQTIEAERNSCTEEIKQLEVLLLESKNKILSLESRDNTHKQNIANDQQKLKEVQAEKEILQSEVTDAKINITAIEQEINALTVTYQQYQQAKQAIAMQQQQLTAEHNKLLSQISASKQEVTQLTGKLNVLLEERVNYQQQHTKQYELKIITLEDLQKLEKDLKELRRKYQDMKASMHDSQMLAAKYSYEVSNCQESLTQNFDMTVTEAEKIRCHDSVEAINKRIKQLESEITLLGPVNHAAIEEYTALNERYQFLQEQYTDLMSAKEYLSSIIADIDKTMEAKFITAFHKINEHFGEVFQKLFAGGEASLTLLEPDNMLETGVDIIVKPPGKKLQNLSLLSGGERAMTVIALLFAVLAYRPAPFIVVDEIDAPLDEANVDRFSEFVRDYAKKTQFIVITHRKGTMEVADIIHGVTVEESGISRMVSVKLMDKAG